MAISLAGFYNQYRDLRSIKANPNGPAPPLIFLNDQKAIWPLTPAVPQYFSLDLRIAWQYKKFEFSIVGKNLLSARHVEFVASQIPRSIYGKIVCRF